MTKWVLHEGLTLPEENLIMLPASVYNDAIAGKGRARFTVAHEIAHFLLIDNNTVKLARTNGTIPKFRDPEWQANTLASEMLIPSSLSTGMSVLEIEKAFGVSNHAASVHLSIKRTERLS